MKKIRITPFSIPWFGFIAYCVISLILMRLFVYPLPLEQRLRFQLILGIAGYVYLRIYKFALSTVKGYDYNYFNELPCYLCNLTAIIGIIGTVLNSRIIGVYCFSIGLAGALLAFMKPDPDFRDMELISIRALGFYGYHSLLVIFCLGFTVLGLCEPQPSDVFGVVGITLVLTLIGHLTNFTVRKLHLCDNANYIFTYDPGDNGILLFFYKLIPVRMLYLLPVALPVGGIYLIIYCIYRLFALVF
ncbi:MAG: YwaF family protein [Erysipelotrichaceae bacterium]|nr:YwaF family protein [Erysipelotrichaceae bacterium]